MQISDESLTEFINLYHAEFGKEITRQDALEMATRLINLYQIIYRPLPTELDGDAMRPSGNPRDLDTPLPNAE